MIKLAGAGRATRDVAVSQPVHGPPIGAFVNVDTVGAQPLGHGVDPVAFLDTKLFHAPHHRLPLGKGGDNGQDRIFVDHRRGTRRRHVDAFHPRREFRPQIRHGFTAFNPFIFIGQVRPHFAQGGKQPCPRRIQPDTGHQNV